jgi:hypothetical protein
MATEIIHPDTEATREGEHVTTASLLNKTTDSAAKSSDGHEPLFRGPETEDFRNRWHDIQGAFVDEPRNAVERADELVANVIQRLTQVFADERGKMEGQWSRGADVSTEDLRQALRRYRSFFDRLLTM